MDEVHQNCDDELIIMNRRCEYCVSKKFICSVVPYFKKLFSSDKLTSKENKVTLDFDERAFDALLDWIHTGLFIIQMDYVISFYEAADYLKIDDRLWDPCINYFHDNFTIEHLPVVLHQVTPKSLLINSGAVNSFICRHFLKIANTNIFLDYPVATIEHILKLDLMIYSEYQIFESIMKWVNKNVYSRKGLLSRLLRFVRWSFMDSVGSSKIKDNELIKTIKNFDSIISSNGDCGFNRCKQNYFVAIQELIDAKLRISIFDKDLFCLPIGDFSEDRTMSLEFVHEENISDILFDAGRRCIRIDWIKKTYTWIEVDANGLYYSETHKLVVNFQNNPSFHKESNRITRN
ncbi:kelch-like protein 6 isoform X2 [Tetranychus urticae]|uniref:kelch-like protein 6 isoform X2 n=1 Tax=Tetranychus urticae TaxID=32264 RepID=UPI000D656EC5|nr:kelch-like protein 6 isoform X2 [Tetranychus urticae]